MSIEAELRAMAIDVQEFNPAAAERLVSLATAFRPEGDLQGWAGVDVFRAIDPAGIVAAIRDQPLVNRGLANLERWRNFLALAPVLLTWLGLTVAAVGYRTAIDVDPKLLGRPFLLLWEEGFQGHVPPPFSLLGFLSLSHVAIGDMALLSVILFLTWRIHGELNVAQAAREIRAREIEGKLHQAVWRASLVLAERTSQSAIIDLFRHASEGLLDELRAERERIGQLANERERGMVNLRNFANGLQHGAQDLLRSSGEVKATFDTLIRVSTSLDDQVAALANQQARLEAALIAIGKEMMSHNHTHRAAVDQLDMVARLLAEAADKSVVAVAGVAEAATQVKAELADLRHQLVEERTAYQSAAKSAEQSASTLAKALETASAAARALEQGSAAMQSLLTPLTAIPANLTAVARLQETAAAAIGAAAKQMASAVAGADERLSASADGLSRSASALDRLIPTIGSLADASAELGRQAQAVARSAPTTRVLVEAWRDVLKEWVEALRASQDGHDVAPGGMPRDVDSRVPETGRVPFWRRLIGG